MNKKAPAYRGGKTGASLGHFIIVYGYDCNTKTEGGGYMPLWYALGLPLLLTIAVLGYYFAKILVKFNGRFG